MNDPSRWTRNDARLKRFRCDELTLSIDGEARSISMIERTGFGPAVLYLHGLGSTKLDFLGAADSDGLPGSHLIAIDAPSVGQSDCSSNQAVTVQQIVEVAIQTLDQLGVDRAIVMGHSCGGAAAVHLAHHHPERLLALVNVEGNLSPRDCDVFSRVTIELADEIGAEAAVQRLIDQLAASGKLGFDTFTRNLSDNIDSETFVEYCRSLVDLSDHEPLLEWFVELEIPRLFVFGSDNADLPYLDRLLESCVPVAEVADSDHFPAYSNPKAFYGRVRAFLEVEGL